MPDNGGRLDRIEAILQRLAERHESLAQTVELLASMQRDNEQRFARHEERMNGANRVQELLTQSQKQLLQAQVILTETIENIEKHLNTLTESQRHSDGRFNALIETQAHTDERLNA